MSKNKLVLIPEDEQRSRAKTDIVTFIDDRWIRNKETVQADIQSVFQKNPYGMSDGTIRNILDELVKERKISTWRMGNNRYYGPLKLPISLKFGVGFAILLFVVVFVVDVFFNYEYVFYLLFHDAMSFLCYSLILIAICTAFAYTIERKLYN